MLKLGFMYLPPIGNIFLHLGCSIDNEMAVGPLLGRGMPLSMAVKLTDQVLVCFQQGLSRALLNHSQSQGV